MRDRILILRKQLMLNQTDFAAKIGVTASAISKVEKGDRAPSEQMILGIVRAFNVSEKWLRTGDGDMFAPAKDTTVAALVEKFQLDGLDRLIIEKYMALPSALKDALKVFIVDLAGEIIGASDKPVMEYTPPTVPAPAVEVYEPAIKMIKNISAPAAPVYPGIPVIDDALRAELDHALAEYESGCHNGDANSPA